MADKTIRVAFDCNEITPEESAALFADFDKAGWLYFAESVIKTDNLKVPDISVGKNDKHPSTRQRNTLYILYSQNDGGYPDFETYYRARMETIINTLKAQIKD